MPAVSETYTTRIKSDKGIIYDINISDIAPGSVTATGVRDGGIGTTRSFLSNDFKLSYKGQDDDIFDPIKSSSLKFPFVISNATDETTIESIFVTNFDVSWYVSIWRDDGGGGGFTLYWWGYLSPLTAKRPNEYYTFEYELEALDILAMSRDVKIWSKQYVTQTYLPSLGITVPIPKYRFGADRQTVGGASTIYPKKYPSVIEAVYSLLFDLDTSAPAVLNALNWWQSFPNTAPPGGAFAYATMGIWWFLFKDMPASANALNFPVIRKKDITVGQILTEICEVFCCRIFQKDGEYWLTQLEQIPSFDKYKYIKGPTATTGNHPLYSGKTTLTSSALITAIAIPQTDPKILEDSYWSKLKGLWGVSLELADAGKTRVYSRNISTSTNNLSDLSAEDITKETQLQEIKFQSGSNAEWTRGGGAAYNTYVSNVRTRMELRNKFRWVFEGTLFASSYDFLHSITYDGKFYKPHTLTHQGSTDEFKCKWFEIRTDATSLGDVTVDVIE
jgi:hypothetical protein